MAQDQRGALYVVWGDVELQLNRSIQSLRAIHPDLPIHVARLPADSSLPDKSKMLDLSPFEQTVFLDADTVVLARLDFAFEQTLQFGIACCIAPCPWARRYAGITGEIIEYNTGVIFFNRSAQPVFEAWKQLARSLDSSCLFYFTSSELRRMPYNDQASFAQAIENTATNPFVLPLNWNFRPQFTHSFFGPLKIWHDESDPPPGLREWCVEQSRDDVLIRYAKRGVPAVIGATTRPE